MGGKRITDAESTEVDKRQPEKNHSSNHDHASTCLSSVRLHERELLRLPPVQETGRPSQKDGKKRFCPEQRGGKLLTGNPGQKTGGGEEGLHASIPPVTI